MSDLDAHHDALLLRGRCGQCAERSGGIACSDGLDCGHSLHRWWCAVPSIFRSDSSRAAGAGGSWLRSRRCSDFFVGTIPLLQSALQVGAVLVLHVVYSTAVAVAHSCTAPRGAHHHQARGCTDRGHQCAGECGRGSATHCEQCLLAGLGFALTAVYVECSLTVIRRRLRWEAAAPPVALGVGLPVALVTALMVSTLAVVGMAAGSLYSGFGRHPHGQRARCPPVGVVMDRRRSLSRTAAPPAIAAPRIGDHPCCRAGDGCAFVWNGCRDSDGLSWLVSPPRCCLVSCLPRSRRWRGTTPTSRKCCPTFIWTKRWCLVHWPRPCCSRRWGCQSRKL